MERSKLTALTILISTTLPLIAQQQLDPALRNWQAPLSWQLPAEQLAGSRTQKAGIRTAGASTASAPLTFVAITPCRLVDTRPEQGQTGAFGPPMLAPYATRTFPLSTHPTCKIPPTAAAYSLNFTAIPVTTLDFLSTWPSGGSYPSVSTLNATQGGVVANAAIVPAGTNGGIDVVAGKNTHFLIDVNGYYAPQQTTIGTSLLLPGGSTVRIANVQINNTTSQVRVLPGSQFTVTMDYQIADPAPATPMSQIEIGFADRSTKEGCAFDGNLAPLPGMVGTATVTLTAPATTGIYYIAADRGQDSYCKATNSYWWTGARNPSHHIGAITVY